MKKLRIHFEDNGQDFLWWDVECKEGHLVARVTDAQPFQASIWTQYYVTNFDKLLVGGKVEYSIGPDHSGYILRYPITKIETL